MNSCSDCKHLIVYAGSTDKYGIPQEPDDYECEVIEQITEEDFDKYFCNGEKWGDKETGCKCFSEVIDYVK